MPTFSLRFLPILIAFCLLPCLFMGRAGASNPVTSGLKLDLEAGVGVFKDAAKTQPATTAGDAVYVWADQSGQGNDFTQATAGSRPAYQPAGLNSLPTVRFDGAASVLTGPLNSPDVSTGSYTFSACFSMRGAAQFQTLFAKMAGGGDRRIWMMLDYTNSQTAGGPAFYSFHRYNGNNNSGTIGGPVPSVVNYPTAGYTVTYQYDASVPAETIWVNGQRAAYNIGAIPAADTTDPYQVGAGGTTANYFMNGDIASEFLYNRLLTATERQSLEAYERAQSGLSTPASFSTANNIIYTGNSLVQSAQSTGGLTFPAQTSTLLGVAYAGLNLGVGGSTTSGWNSGASMLIDQLFYAGVPNVCVFWEGTNDLAGGAVTPTAAYNNIVTYCKARRQAGFQVIVLTVLPRNSTTGTYNTPALFETARQSVNTLLRTNWPSFASALVDIGNDPTIGQAGQYSNTTYYQSDGVHLTNTGYGVVAAATAPVIKALIYTAGGTKRRIQ